MFFNISLKDAYLITPTAGKAMYTVFVIGSAAWGFASSTDSIQSCILT